MATKPTRKAFGHSLSDFPKLSKVEYDLIEHCRIGKPLEIGDGTRPEKPTIKNKIRPELIRFLLLGGDAQNPIHENGVQLAGAWIEGDWNIWSCICQARLIILNSTINGHLFIQNSSLPILILSGSHIKGISADGAVITGGVFLDKGFKTTGQVRLLGAQIGGQVACSDAEFEPDENLALDASYAVVKGGVFLNGSFKTNGTVILHQIHIDGSIDCSRATFGRRDGDSFRADGAIITGNASFENLKATGTIYLRGAQIGNDLICRNANFKPEKGEAFRIDGARISGNLFLDGALNISGPACFYNTKIGSLIDNPDLQEVIHLDGLTYGSFAGGAPTDATTRIAWLHKQPRSHLYEDFRPQPWEQLIKVLRSMGHKADADIVAIAKQDQLYKSGKITGLNILWHKLYGWFAGYGYKPIRTVAAMLFVWIFWAELFDYAKQSGWMAPSSPIIHTDRAIIEACTKDAESRQQEKAKITSYNDAEISKLANCRLLPNEYTTFNPLIYSLDLILPLVDLQQEHDWSPMVLSTDPWISYRSVIRLAMWFEILFGWMASLLLVAVLGNLVKKD